MKALYCPSCHDMFALQLREWKDCSCGECGGQYNQDTITATILGKAKVLGIPNDFLKNDPKDAKKGEIWFGGFEGDNQIMKRKSVRKIYPHNQVLKMFKPNGANLMTEQVMNRASLEYYHQMNFNKTDEPTARRIALTKFPKGN